MKEWCAGCIYIKMVRSGWHIGPTEHTGLVHWLVYSHFFTSPYGILNKMQVISLLLKADLKWHSYCGSTWCWWNRKQNQYRLENPSCWIILGVMWLQHAVQGVCLLWGEAIYRVWPGSNQRQEGSLVLVARLGGLHSIIKDHSSLQEDELHVKRYRTTNTDAKEKKLWDTLMKKNSQVDLHRADCVCSYSLLFVSSLWIWRKYENTVKASNSSCTQSLFYSITDLLVELKSLC